MVNKKKGILGEKATDAFKVWNNDSTFTNKNSYKNKNQAPHAFFR